MRRSTCWYLIRSDTYRVDGRVNVRGILRTALQQPSVRIIVLFRWGAWARATSGHRVARAITSLLYGRYSTLYGIEIPFATQVGPGLRINHRVGGVIINGASRLGSAVTLNSGVLLGAANSDEVGAGAPSVHDRAVLAVGCSAIGPITIGQGAVIAARALVTRDVPSGVVAAGIPARVMEGAEPFQARRVNVEDVLGPVPDDAFTLTAV